MTQPHSVQAAAGKSARATTVSSTDGSVDDMSTVKGSVRLTLCVWEKPAEKRPVVVPRAADLAELLKTAKSKLKLKNEDAVLGLCLSESLGGFCYVRK